MKKTIFFIWFFHHINPSSSFDIDLNCLSNAIVARSTPNVNSISFCSSVKFAPYNEAQLFMPHPSSFNIDFSLSSNITDLLCLIAYWFWYAPHNDNPVENLYSSFKVLSGLYFPFSQSAACVNLWRQPIKFPSKS